MWIAMMSCSIILLGLGIWCLFFPGSVAAYILRQYPHQSRSILNVFRATYIESRYYRIQTQVVGILFIAIAMLLLIGSIMKLLAT
jgi:hypothetical protein